ncbi:hypothetical protein QEH52_10100 [Coraliomargarita sp. SDUM461003]|uniref:Uncharacterized protein n=1 Tax=Thalassobacterium maritimum TaxID=3041265 RepID=A0ABU1AUP8_9BACT|nr:hypothetical protein [Coraliomargarita sp. SDUM461003]MDQ8207863.1 hypothetical protein [Coraliomargarita sp. SDUM461003]
MVVTEEPAGGEILRSKGKGWGGTWVGTNEAFHIDATDSLAGEVEIFVVGGNNKNNFALKSTTGLLRKGSDHIFLNLKLSDVSQRQVDPILNDYWYAFIVEKEGDTIRLFIPDYNQLIKESAKGRGRFEQVDSHYLLKGTSEEIAESLANDLPLALFDELKRLPNRIESIGVKETTDLGKYESLLADVGSSYVAHFPKEIENDSSRYQLSFQPKFLQGGGHFHLEERMLPKAVVKLHERMMGDALAYKDIGQSTSVSIRADVDEETPSIGYHTSDNAYSLPKGFRIFYTLASPYKNEGFKWNHGSIAGIAIHLADGRVIYFYENW